MHCLFVPKSTEDPGHQRSIGPMQKHPAGLVLQYPWRGVVTLRSPGSGVGKGLPGEAWAGLPGSHFPGTSTAWSKVHPAAGGR